MAKSVRYHYPEMKRFLDDAFMRFGFTAEEAAQITDVLAVGRGNHLATVLIRRRFIAF